MYSVITVYSAYGEINVMITELNIMGHRTKIWITESKNVKKTRQQSTVQALHGVRWARFTVPGAACYLNDGYNG